MLKTEFVCSSKSSLAKRPCTVHCQRF